MKITVVPKDDERTCNHCLAAQFKFRDRPVASTLYAIEFGDKPQQKITIVLCPACLSDLSKSATEAMQRTVLI